MNLQEVLVKSLNKDNRHTRELVKQLEKVATRAKVEAEHIVQVAEEIGGIVVAREETLEEYVERHMLEIRRTR